MRRRCDAACRAVPELYTLGLADLTLGSHSVVVWGGYPVRARGNRQRRSFVTARGYDRDEVRAFLSELAETVATPQREQEALQRELARARPRAVAHGATPPADPGTEEIAAKTAAVLAAAHEAAGEIERQARLQTARLDAARDPQPEASDAARDRCPAARTGGRADIDRRRADPATGPRPPREADAASLTLASVSVRREFGGTGAQATDGPRRSVPPRRRPTTSNRPTKREGPTSRRRPTPTSPSP